jgi:hypothetical protein
MKLRMLEKFQREERARFKRKFIRFRWKRQEDLCLALRL